MKQAICFASGGLVIDLMEMLIKQWVTFSFYLLAVVTLWKIKNKTDYNVNRTDRAGVCAFFHQNAQCSQLWLCRVGSVRAFLGSFFYWADRFLFKLSGQRNISTKTRAVQAFMVDWFGLVLLFTVCVLRYRIQTSWYGFSRHHFNRQGNTLFEFIF